MGTEKALQTKILKHLEKEGWIVVKTIGLNKNGYPDIFSFKRRTAIFIEVKSDIGKASELQKYRIEQLKKEGFEAEVVNDFNQVLKLLKRVNV